MFPKFEKYEGLGNDFVIVTAEAVLSRQLAVRICDRHFGVGADGVLVLTRPHSSDARARMTVLNADGSQPELCGNGLRCVALHLAREDGLANAEYVVETDAGPRRCVVACRNGQSQIVLSMGRAQSLGTLSESWNGRPYIFQRVSIGNPHAVLLDAKLTGREIDMWAPSISASLAAGTNVEFVSARADGAYDLIVWERGVGRTLACGTGAAAVASVLAREGRTEFDTPIPIHLPGGPLELTVSAETLEVSLRGPARHVFTGTLGPALTEQAAIP